MLWKRPRKMGGEEVVALVEVVVEEEA